MMTFDDWMRSERVTYKPTDDSVTDRLLRRCWDAAVAEERERLAAACWERRGHFASDAAARAFAELVRDGLA